MINVDVGKTGIANVLTLVQENNPGLPFELSESNVTLGEIGTALSGVTKNPTYGSYSQLDGLSEWVDELGLFVSIKSGGTGAVSTDGETWTGFTHPGSVTFSGFYYSSYHDLLFTWGSSTIMSSPDGVNWTLVNIPGISLIRFVRDSPNTGMLISNSNLYGEYYTSVDLGQTWVLRQGGQAAFTTCIFVSTPTQDMFVLNGTERHLTTVDATTGLVLQNAFNVASTGFRPNKPVYSQALDKLFYTIDSSSQRLITFSNFSTAGFTEVTETVLPFTSAVYLHSNKTDDAIIISSETNFTVTTDGVNFAPVGYFPNINTYGIMYATDLDKYIGGNTVGYVASSDLETWEVHLTEYAGGSTIHYDPVLKRTIYLGIGGLTGILNFDNTWTFLQNNLYRRPTWITYSETLNCYITGGASQPINKSTDLVNWTEVTSNSFQHAIWIEELELFVAVGATIETSADGETWTLKHTPVVARLKAAWSPTLSKIVVVGGNTGYSHSSDGETWTDATTAFTGMVFSNIVWSTKREEFLFHRGSTATLAVTSDLVNFVTGTSPLAASNIKWVDGLNLYVNIPIGTTSNVYVSTTGLSWTAHPLGLSYGGQSGSITNFVWDAAKEWLCGVSVNARRGSISFRLSYRSSTAVQLVAVEDAGYSGTVNVNYYRPTIVDTAGAEQDLPIVLLDTGLYDPEDKEVYEADALVQIANTLGMRASELRITSPIPVPNNDNDHRTIRVSPRSDSYVYSGGSYTVTVAAIDTDVPLSSIITIPSLDGFMW